MPTVTVLCTRNFGCIRNFACTNVHAEPLYVHENQSTQILNLSSLVFACFHFMNTNVHLAMVRTFLYILSQMWKIRFFSITFFPRYLEPENYWNHTVVTPPRFLKKIPYILVWRWKSNNLWLWNYCRAYQAEFVKTNVEV